MRRWEEVTRHLGEVFVNGKAEPCTEELSGGAGSGDGCLRSLCRIGMKSISIDLSLSRWEEMLRQDFLAASWMERCQDVTGIPASRLPVFSQTL